MMQPYNNHCKNPLYHRFDAHVCPICGHSLYEKSSTSINTAPSAAKTLFLVFLAVIMQISWIVFVFLMLFAPFAQAIPSLSAPAHICTSEGHDNMLTATHDGKCPAPIHAPLTHHDKACLDHAAGKTPSIWDILREKQQNKIAEIETKRITEEKMESKAQSPEQTPPPSSHQISLLSPSYSSSDAIAPAHSTSSSLAAMQIFALGTAVSYVDAAGWEAAPSCGAGLWYGSDSVSDDDLGYFIGHHPGDFAFVMDLKIGDIVTVKDRYEQQETYDVTRVFNWSQNGYLADVLAEIGSWNESIILQTCVGDKQNIRIVFAERSVKD